MSASSEPVANGHAKPAAVRRTVRYEGRVQGVNFRRSAARVALGYPVTGYVRNERDGTVRLIGEGDPAVLDSFLDDVAEVMEGFITGVRVEEGMATDEFVRFTIKQ